MTLSKKMIAPALIALFAVSGLAMTSDAAFAKKRVISNFDSDSATHNDGGRTHDAGGNDMGNHDGGGNDMGGHDGGNDNGGNDGGHDSGNDGGNGDGGNDDGGNDND